MKVGVRKPSLKKSIKARTTGKAKRTIKKATIPGYGEKGMGYINDPKKAVYNKVYNKTTIGVDDLIENTNTNNNKITVGEVFGCLGAIFELIGIGIQLIVALGQVIFGVVLLVIIIKILF